MPELALPNEEHREVRETGETVLEGRIEGEEPNNARTQQQTVSRVSGSSRGTSRGAQPRGRYWICTIPRGDWVPMQPRGCQYLAGQCERGERTGYEHWQFIAYYPTKVVLSRVKSDFGRTCHAELTRSDAAEGYCCKSQTKILGTEFSFGKKSVQRNSKRDWDACWEAAKQGDFDSLPADIKLRSWCTLKRIAIDHVKAQAIEKEVVVLWGPTGTGKSRKAWSDAGLDAYPKDPMSKFWDGYNGQENVVIDEFRGGINISHVLRWLDRYPTIVEVKGASVCLKAKKIWITSNLDPRRWYDGLDKETLDALLRRFKTVIHMVKLGEDPPAQGFEGVPLQGPNPEPSADYFEWFNKSLLT